MSKNFRLPDYYSNSPDLSLLRPTYFVLIAQEFQCENETNYPIRYVTDLVNAILNSPPPPPPATHAFAGRLRSDVTLHNRPTIIEESGYKVLKFLA